MTISVSAIFTLLLAAAPATTPSTAPDRVTFTDDAQTFFLTLPSTWRPGNLPRGRGGMLLVGPGPATKPSATPMLRVQSRIAQSPDVPQLTLDQYAREAANQVTGKVPDDVKIESTTLGGVDAREFRSSRKDSKGVEVDMRYVVVLRQPKAWTFTYLQEKDLFDPAQADAVFAAVRWNDNKPQPATKKTP